MYCVPYCAGTIKIIYVNRKKVNNFLDTYIKALDSYAYVKGLPMAVI